MGIPLTGRPFVPHGLICEPFIFKDLFSLFSFQATPDILRHLNLQGAQDSSRKQNSGSLIERIVHYRRSHFLASRMTAGSSLYKDGYKVDRDLTPRYVNHAVAVLEKYLAAAC